MLGALVLSLTAMVSCDDELPPVQDDVESDPDVCAIVDCEPEPDVPEVDEPDPGPDTRVDDDQCELKWSYTRPEGGVTSHPLVSEGGLVTITAGNTLRRIALDGSESEVCGAPFVLSGEQLGTPSQDLDGKIWVGTASGKLVVVNRKCEMADDPIDVELACIGSPTECSALVADSIPRAIREAPAHSDGWIYVLDEQPALHRISEAGDYGNFFISTDEHLPVATTVIATAPGGASYVAFPTRHTVAFVKASNHAKVWTWEETVEEGGAERQITAPLALTSDGKVLAIGAEVAGDTHTGHQLYRLVVDVQAKQGWVDDGFPIALDLPLDTIHGLVVGADESIYAATRAHGVIRFDKAGQEQWRFIGDEESLRVTTVPTLGDDAALYFTAEPHHVYGVDTDGNRIFRHVASGELRTTSPAIRDDGMVIVHFGTDLQAWRCPTSGLANSSWPRYQRNNRNSGNQKESN